jgi:hypothetical protein
VIPTEHNTKTPPATTGLFALLGALLHAQGIGAPKIAQGRSAPSRALLLLTALASLCALAGALGAVLPSPASAGTCPNEEFRTGAGAKLPDCRAYELVSPPFTEASNPSLHSFTFLGSFEGMSADGSHLGMTSVGDFGDSDEVAEGNNYEVTRTASGWKETGVDIPVSRFPAGEVAAEEEYEKLSPSKEPTEPFASKPLVASPDFGEILYQTPQTADGEAYPGSFWIGEADGALHHIGPAKGHYLETSAELPSVLFESGYENHQNNGILAEEQYAPGQEVAAEPVGVEPNGNSCAAKLAATYGSAELKIRRPVSTDGSTVFFTCSSELFARIDESRTVAISEPSPADCSACDTGPGVQVPVELVDGASADGSKVFFTTTQPLLGSQTETSANIYEYDFDLPQASPGDPDGRIVQVTAGKWEHGGAQVTGVVGVSEDGSHVYFTAGGVLSGAMNNQGRSPREGEANQYVYDTETGRTAFIAAGAVTGLEQNTGGSNPNITPDGRFLVFASTADLTPGDTSTAQQVFEYDAETGELIRVSIGQDGFNDNGNTDSFGAEIPREIPGDPVAVSNNGEYVAFESPDGLTPGALNGDLQEVDGQSYYPENVYEYHDGNVYLISDGQDTSIGLGSRYTKYSKSEVELDGMSPSGENIFFSTADRLVPQALSTGVAIYDARIDGGFAAPVSLLPTCSGDACQGPLSASPTLLSPGSEFQAGGNPPLAASEPVPAAKPKAKSKTAKCKKGYVKKKDKCVKKPKAKKSAKGRK